VRERVNHVSDLAELDALLEEYREYLLRTSDTTYANSSYGEA